MKLDGFLQKTTSWLFTALFFLVPLFFTPLNSELFEFNKIILVYAFSVLITGTWISRMVLQKKFIFKRTFFDIPLFLFLLSQIISTILSIDPHTSIFGYYSRFNGGLLSLISYLLLYWAFVSNCETKDVLKVLKSSLVSALIISIYGISEHFGHSFSCLMFGNGFNVSCWVQKVQERVFATLGQPNWLAAYLAVLVPLTWFFILRGRSIFYILNSIFFACLLFTQSRSGFLGFGLSYEIFWGIQFLTNRRQIKSLIKPFLILNSIFLILMILFGSPFAKINNLFKGRQPAPTAQTAIPGVPSDDGGISESGDIRKIVWKGAVGIFKHYPVFGSGVETFAYSYYNFRPIEHNLVSEWDFLYNKAHNEYLNYLSTTGIFGLGTYLALICFFIYYNLRSISNYLLPLALFSGWLSLLVTNFFGFSVVVTSLYFYLIPAFVFVLYSSNDSSTLRLKATFSQKIILLIVLFLSLGFESKVIDLWRADLFYNQGLKLSKQGQYYKSYQKFDQAIQISPNEPVFLSEISAPVANLALIAFQQEQASTSAEMVKLALAFSNKAKTISPKNLNILKTRIKVFYTISNLQSEFLQKAIETTQEAIALSPTDPKLVYNLGLLYGKSGQGQLAIQTIEKAVEMKPNYYEARNTLAIFYEDIGENQKALQQLEILLKLAPENKETFEKRIEKLK